MERLVTCLYTKIRWSMQLFGAALALILLAVGVWTFNLILVGAAVASALLAGRVFCGWMCPMGAWCDHVLAKLAKSRPAHRFSPWAGRLFAAIFIAAFVYLAHTGLFGRWLPFVLMGTTFVLVTATGLLWGPRTWCGSLCPWGTLAGLATRLAPYQLFTGKDCRQCGRCVRACPVGGALQPGSPGSAADASCIRCLLCLEACPSRSVLLEPGR
jgi:polyferredoxin